MDLHLLDAEPTGEEREAVDALLGPPRSGWDGGTRDPVRDTHVAFGGHAARAQRHHLLPALHAVQSRVGWISEGALNYVCQRLTVPPADAWGVATFYALFSTTPRPRRVLHVCDDIACRCRGANELIAALEKEAGPEHHAPTNGHVEVGAAAPARQFRPDESGTRSRGRRRVPTISSATRTNRSQARSRIGSSWKPILLRWWSRWRSRASSPGASSDISTCAASIPSRTSALPTPCRRRARPASSATMFSDAACRSSSRSAAAPARTSAGKRRRW